MSIQDQESFLSKIHPFEVLTPSQMATCVQHMDIAYYPKDTVLISLDKIPEHFFIIIKGSVLEYNAENIVVMDYQSEDTFDSNSLIYGKCDNTFKVNEELICYEIEKQTFLNLIEKNQAFKDFFLKDLVNKIQTLKNKEYTSQLSSFMIAKVEDTLIHEACIVDKDTKLIDAIDKSMKFKTSTIIVKVKDGEYGIITDSLLKVKVLLQGRDLSIPVKDIAIFPLLTIKNDDYLFEALTILVKKNIKRVGVTNHNGQMIGILEQIDILSHFANHTYVIESKIKNAKNIEDLKDASKDFIDIIISLQAKGVKIHHISNLIGELNTKVYQKIFSLILPENLQKDACLFVMGSEGRSEQILRTDQDNALIIADDCNISEENLKAFTYNFTETLVEFGFPRCEGNIMVSNPYWCRKMSDFKELIYKWISEPSGDNFMNIAIFYDALCVCGEIEIIRELKAYLFKSSSNSQSFYSNFAKIINSFDVPLGFFDGFVFNSKDKKHKNEIDIKRGGIFILVQGIRALSLQNKILNTNTVKRINALKEIKVLDEEMAKELIMAFNFLMSLKLKSNLEKLDKKEKIDNYINPNNLTIMEKDLLKESFKIVNKLKKKLETHFKLNYV